jgi:hypothetical protein
VRFEQAILKALGTLPPGYWQRIDGLLCEHDLLELPESATWFRGTRLRLLELRGLIESRDASCGMLSFRGLRSYRLAQ